MVRRKEDFGIFPAGLADEARGCLPCDVRNRQENPLLKGVSRSFYLSLRFLPKPMRGAASLGYLLARTSDTLADTAALEVEVRRQALVAFRRSLAGSEEAPRWQVSLLNAVSDVRERHLLEGSGDLFEWLARLPDGESALVREVVDIIISGQLADLEWFGAATRENPVALADDAALEDYTWRVAGCVGAFWTKLGFLTIGERFSNIPPADLERLGVRYGKGLQLVNILRDLPADLANGRCYLPVGNPHNVAELMECHANWVERACEWTSAGPTYAATLGSRRLRAASALPAMIADRTLERLRDSTWQVLQKRVRVPRWEVYVSLVKALMMKQR